MSQRVHIPKPCSADWDKMSPVEKGRFCSECQTPVIDFSQMTLNEVQDYFKENQHKHFCGYYQKRHTSQAGLWQRLLTGVETFFHGTPMRKAALLFISFALIVSGCRSRRTSGMYSRAPHSKHNNRKAAVATFHVEPKKGKHLVRLPKP